MAASRPAPYEGPWTSRARDADLWMSQHKVVFSATAASLISTFAGFPLDSLKSRIQSSRENLSIPRLAAQVVHEEGLGGLWRGFPLPLITISIVRTISFTIYTSTKRILNSVPGQAPAISTTQPRNDKGKGKGKQKEVEAPWVDVKLGLFNQDTARDVALTSLLAGGASGAVVCGGSAPFELVKVRRQLEYQIYRDSHPEHFRRPSPTASVHPPPNMSLSHHPAGTSASIIHQSLSSSSPSPSASASASTSSLGAGAGAGAATATAAATAAAGKAKPPPFVPPTTLQAVRMIIDSAGYKGLYTGWRLHFVRDTLGTALYFAEYDVMRHLLGRKRDGTSSREGDGLVQGDVPDWAKGWLPKGMIPFLCGSLAGVTSWALIYPVDAIKTKAQQRALSGLEPRTSLVQITRLVRGTDANNPKPLLAGIGRLYRGLGVSMARSMLTHGLLWTIVDAAGNWIDTRPLERWAGGDSI